MRLLGLLLLIFVLSGCTNVGEGYRFIELQVDPISDESGLIYVEGDGTYEIFAELRNDMLNPAENVRVEVSNVNFGIIDFSGFEQAVTSTANTLNGTKDNLNTAFIDASIAITEPKSGRYSTNVQYNLCARASTTLTDTICIAPAKQRGAYEQTCNPSEKTIDGGQGSPVAITSIRQTNTPAQVIISIDIYNQGTGLVFSGDGCTTIDQREAGIIELESFRIGDRSFVDTCTVSRLGFDREYQTRSGGTVTCTIDKDSLSFTGAETNTVESSFDIEFSYDYHVLADTQPIIIRKV